MNSAPWPAAHAHTPWSGPEAAASTREWECGGTARSQFNENWCYTATLLGMARHWQTGRSLDSPTASPSCWRARTLHGRSSHLAVRCTWPLWTPAAAQPLAARGWRQHRPSCVADRHTPRWLPLIEERCPCSCFLSGTIFAGGYAARVLLLQNGPKCFDADASRAFEEVGCETRPEINRHRSPLIRGHRLSPWRAAAVAAQAGVS